jgi:hypothetical protein
MKHSQNPDAVRRPVGHIHTLVRQRLEGFEYRQAVREDLRQVLNWANRERKRRRREGLPGLRRGRPRGAS